MACAWAGAELLAEGTAAVPAGQRAWLAASAPLTHISSPAQSSTVLGREQATALGLPHKLEKGLLMLFSSVLAHGSAVSWACLNERDFKEFGLGWFSAQRVQALSALLGGNTNNPSTLLWDNLFWTKLLYCFGVLEAVLFLIIFISAAPQRPYHYQDTIFLAIQNVNQCLPQRGDDLSMSWRLKGGCEVARVQCTKALAHRHPSV